MRYIFTVLILMLLLSCEKEQIVATKGVIKDYSWLDACTWLIEVEEDDKVIRYDPINLNDFKIVPKNGQQVKFKYKPFDGAGSCMAGPIIKLTSLKEDN